MLKHLVPHTHLGHTYARQIFLLDQPRRKAILLTQTCHTSFQASLASFNFRRAMFGMTCGSKPRAKARPEIWSAGHASNLETAIAPALGDISQHQTYGVRKRIAVPSHSHLPEEAEYKSRLAGPLSSHLTLSLKVGIEEELSGQKDSRFHILHHAIASDGIQIIWGDGHVSHFHSVWLRDNCRCSGCYHPMARERMVDTCSIPLDIRPIGVDVIHSTTNLKGPMLVKQNISTEDGYQLQVTWNEFGKDQSPHIGIYPLTWLRERCYSPKTMLPAKLPTNCVVHKHAANKQANSDKAAREAAEDPRAGWLHQSKGEWLAPFAGENGYNCVLWTASDMEDWKPIIKYDKINCRSKDEGGHECERDEALLEWLELIHTYGFCIVDGVPNTPFKHCEEVARRISFLRTTFWGDTWAVKSEPNPQNLSLTGSELFPHTDFAWAESPPGLQFLHCRRFTGGPSVGGESTIVDGFAAAELLRQTDPTAFALLSTVKIPFQFQSPTHEFMHRNTVIQLEDGLQFNSPQYPESKGNSRNGSQPRVVNVRFNQANLAPLDIAPSLVMPMYRAIAKFASILRGEIAKEGKDCANDRNLLLSFKLEEGQMLVFNNRRMLHGRKAYNPNVTERHLEGCYLDEDEFLSRLMMLRKTADQKIARKLQNAPCETRTEERGSLNSMGAIQPEDSDLRIAKHEALRWVTLPSGAEAPSWSVSSAWPVRLRTHPVAVASAHNNEE